MEKHTGKVILDQNGNEIGRIKGKKNIIGWMKKNLWNLCGMGLGILGFLYTAVRMFANHMSAIEYSKYYGIPKKYFENTNVFEEKMILLIISIILLLYLFILNIFNKNTTPKIIKVIFSCCAVFTLFIQNLIYTIKLLEKFDIVWVHKTFDNYLTIFIFLISDIIIVYSFIVKNPYNPELRSKIAIVKKIILGIALIINIGIIILGISTTMSMGVEDEKYYETITVANDSKVIISEYEGKFIVMDYELNDDNSLIILQNKGYNFININTGIVDYKRYNKVEVRK